MPSERTRQRLLHLAVPALLLAGVAALATVLAASATAVQLDAALGGAVRTAASSVGRPAGFAASALGGTDIALPLTAAGVVVLCLLRHWRGALTLGLAVLATQGVVQLIKAAVERPRPAANQAVADASGFSFPSAHSATSMALYATLGLLAARACRGHARLAVAATAGAVIAAVGLSRVLLAAHYPTDVVAGWLTGAALAAGSWLLFRRLGAPRMRPATQ